MDTIASATSHGQKFGTARDTTAATVAFALNFIFVLTQVAVALPFAFGAALVKSTQQTIDLRHRTT